MRVLIFMLALVAASCGSVRTRPVTPVPLASVETSAILVKTASSNAVKQIDAGVTAGTLTRESAIRQVSDIKRLATALEQFSADLPRWQAASGEGRAAVRKEVLERLAGIAAILADRPPWWGPILDAYAQVLLTAGGAR